MVINEYKVAVANSRYEIGAIINALMLAKTGDKETFTDYSKGADHWDGKDLVLASRSNPHRNYSWSIESKEMTLQYYKSFGTGAATSKANPANWTYKNSGYQILATVLLGGSMLQSNF